MLSYASDQGVLTLTLHQDPGINGRAACLERISELVYAYRSQPVVVVLEGSAAQSLAAVSVVLRAHRLCGELGSPMTVVADSVSTRQLLEANATGGGCKLVVCTPAGTPSASAPTEFTAAA